ncbi:energy transducer TonB [Alteraurantiacibacter palmitatis]|uniref:Energy transducer TonB n=1 Tax=Alteraurantiacibacter palmitatis TaxID=2054628 RepID=A0ABV7E478_9SPHN
MAYLDHPHTHRRLAGVAGVAAVHAVLAVGLAAGLTITYTLAPPEPPIKGETVVVKLPPPPEPVPDPVQNTPTPAPPIAPPAPIPIQQAAPIDTVIDFPPERDVARTVQPPADTLPTRPADPPAPAFTPRPPVPANSQASWITNADYPSLALRRELEGDVAYELVIDPRGRVSECRITASSGHRLLDTETCRLIERRARFTPASDEKGQSTGGTWRGSVRWTIPER